MPKKRYNAEEIIHKLLEADVLIAQGKTVLETCKQLGVTEQTYYRWRKEYGGLRIDQAKRLKDLEKENARLKKLLAEAEVDKAILMWVPAVLSHPIPETSEPVEAPPDRGEDPE